MSLGAVGPAAIRALQDLRAARQSEEDENLRKVYEDAIKKDSSGITGGFFIGEVRDFGRAYSWGRGESVTRGDRRRRELEFGRPSPPLARPRESTARVGFWTDGLAASQTARKTTR